MLRKTKLNFDSLVNGFDKLCGFTVDVTEDCFKGVSLHEYLELFP